MKENLDSNGVVDIDEHRLDSECVRLPNDFLRWANQAADLRQTLDRLKAEMEVVKADFDRRIRQTPAAYGIEKITETAVDGAIKLQKSYQAKLVEIQKAKHDLDLTEAVVQALEHKKRSLTLLVDLHGMGYFSEVRPSARGKEAVKSMMKERVKPIPRRSREED